MNDLKKQNIIYVTTDDDLKTILSCFKVNHISHVPVKSGNKIVGMISKTDVVEYLYDNHDQFNTRSYMEVLQDIKAKHLMVQPLIYAATSEPEMAILDKLLDHQVSSVVLKDDRQKVVGIVTEKDIIKYLADRKDKELNFGEKIGLNVVQWLDEHGIIRVSKMLGDIGI